MLEIPAPLFLCYRPYKYTPEAFSLVAYVNTAASRRLANQVTWSWTVNMRGHKGQNIPIDFHMEHLNRSLQDIILGLGANITENHVVQSSKSLKGVVDVSVNYEVCGATPDSIHHTKKGSQMDRDIVLNEFTSRSRLYTWPRTPLCILQKADSKCSPVYRCKCTLLDGKIRGTNLSQTVFTGRQHHVWEGLEIVWLCCKTRQRLVQQSTGTE